nr:lipocalin family protein [Phytohalomonas tamaricis]
MGGHTDIPSGTAPIEKLDVERYLGTWYEIARLDHSFERGLSCVTATYEARADGGIKVINRGYDTQKEEWDEAEGKAYFDDKHKPNGRLKVSFFGPFYGGYNILYLDESYRHALVAGPSHDYLWILSRTPTMAEADFTALVDFARDKGFDVDGLIMVDHESSCPAH